MCRPALVVLVLASLHAADAHNPCDNATLDITSGRGVAALDANGAALTSGKQIPGLFGIKQVHTGGQGRFVWVSQLDPAMMTPMRPNARHWHPQGALNHGDGN
jgi:hypothetical protein